MMIETKTIDDLIKELRKELREYRLTRPQIFGTDAHEESLRATIQAATHKLRSALALIGRKP